MKGTVGTRRETVEFTSSRRTWLPFVFVIFSLSALVLIPFLLERRITVLRREVVDILEPARLSLGRIELAFAREDAAVRSYLLSRDPRFLDLFRSVRADEEQQLRRLERRLVGLDAALAARVVALRQLAAGWHGEQLAVLRGEASAAEFLRQAPADEVSHERILEPAIRLDAELARLALVRRAEVRRLERRGRIAAAALALLAVAAALQVAHTAHHFRRRAREEHALRDAALLLTRPVELEEIHRRVATTAIAVTSADGAYVEWLTADGAEAEVVAATGPFAPRLGVRASYPGSVSEQGIGAGAPELVPRVERDKQRPMFATFHASAAGCSAIALPLKTDGAPQGALVLLRCSRTRPYRAADLTRAATFGGLAALALRNAMLLTRAEERSAELQRATEGKARLIRGFSHDLKNPLAAADAMAVLLEEGIVKGESQLETIGRIRASIQSALTLIADMVDLSLAETGKLQIRWECVDLPPLIRSVAEQFSAAALTAQHQLEIDVPDSLPRLETDPTRVRQVLENLMSNAIKYTPTGGTIAVQVAVRAGRHSGDTPQDHVTISVRDTGPGIAPEQQRVLFEEFTRLAPDAQTGSGLGLAISRRIAHALGGEISVASELGRGSTFTLCLPATRRS